MRRGVISVLCFVIVGARLVRGQPDKVNSMSYQVMMLFDPDPICEEYYTFPPGRLPNTRRLTYADYSTVPKNGSQARIATLTKCADDLAANVAKTSQSLQPDSNNVSPYATQLVDQIKSAADQLKAAMAKPASSEMTLLGSRIVAAIDSLKGELKGQNDKPVDLLTKEMADDLAGLNTTNATARLAEIRSDADRLIGRKPRVTEATMHDALLSEYLAFRNIRNWVLDADYVFRHPTARPITPASSTSPPVPDETNYTALLAAFNKLQTTVRMEMEHHDLTPAFSAELITGLNVFQSAGSVQSNPTPGYVQAAKATGSASPVAYISWESKHYGAERGTPSEFSLSGKFGEIPSLVLLVPKAVPATSPCNALKTSCLADLSVASETAITGSLAARLNIPAWETAEMSLRAGGGESYLTSDTFIVGQGVGSTAANPIANGTGQAAPFWDLGAELNIYGKQLALVHTTKDVLAPMFHAEAGFRHDGRFKNAGDLKNIMVGVSALTTSSFDRPEQRYFYRFTLGNISLQSKDDQGPHTFFITFGVEGEGAWPISPDASRPHVPAAVRLFVKGDVNLLKAFTPSGK
jgi:hypothetical protein